MSGHEHVTAGGRIVDPGGQPACFRDVSLGIRGLINMSETIRWQLFKNNLCCFARNCEEYVCGLLRLPFNGSVSIFHGWAGSLHVSLTGVFPLGWIIDGRSGVSVERCLSKAMHAAAFTVPLHAHSLQPIPYSLEKSSVCIFTQKFIEYWVYLFTLLQPCGDDLLVTCSSR